MTVLLQVDAGQLEAAAKDIGVGAAAIQRTLFRAINSVAAKAMTRTRREIVSQVNLKPAYVRERIALRKAGKDELTAVVAARQRATRLATYGAIQRVKAVKPPKSLSPEARAKYMAKLKGDKLRGIAPGKKQAGIAVSVKRGGGRKLMSGGFMIPLRAGKVAGAVNGLGVFLRTGPGRKDISHRYGPSVDQVMKGVIKDISPDVSAELEAAIRRQAGYEFENALKK